MGHVVFVLLQQQHGRYTMESHVTRQWQHLVSRQGPVTHTLCSNELHSNLCCAAAAAAACAGLM
jgi:hypothetical protein